MLVFNHDAGAGCLYVACVAVSHMNLRWWAEPFAGMCIHLITIYIYWTVLFNLKNLYIEYPSSLLKNQMYSVIYE